MRAMVFPTVARSTLAIAVFHCLNDTRDTQSVYKYKIIRRFCRCFMQCVSWTKSASAIGVGIVRLLSATVVFGSVGTRHLNV